jgi:hypothetical protein
MLPGLRVDSWVAWVNGLLLGVGRWRTCVIGIPLPGREIPVGPDVPS